MKVGDLVRCPVNLETGEIFSGEFTIAVITQIFKNKPRIEVAYVNHKDDSIVSGVWFIEELEIINES